MRAVRDTPYFSKVIGRMPEGCRMCVKGAKLVLFVTGLCVSRCWYCPLSARKKGRDVVIADEWWVKSDRDILEEARLCNSLGAGITGGDPMLRMDRTEKYIRLLKKNFGGNFHIHLYTSGALASIKNLERLHRAGLDEIRFHPKRADWPAVKNALKFGWEVGCEIPAIPGSFRETSSFIDYISDAGVGFLNINELEFSETNMNQMLEHGMRTINDVSYAIRGSGSTALKLLDYCSRNTRLDVHYCTVRLKDRVQLGNRLKRRAKNAARQYDITTKEGLFIRGAVYLPDLYPSFHHNRRIEGLDARRRNNYLRRLERIAEAMRRDYKLKDGLVEVDRQRLRILSGAWVVEEIADELKKRGLKPAVVEEYPTWDALCVDLRFL